MTRPTLAQPHPLYGDPVRLARYRALLAEGHMHCAMLQNRAAWINLYAEVETASESAAAAVADFRPTHQPATIA